MPARVSDHFAALRSALSRLPAESPWLAEAYLAYARFAATVRCGHTDPNFTNPSDAVQRTLFDGMDKLPAEFRWVDGFLFVTRDCTSDGALPPGTVIQAINGTRTADISSAFFRSPAPTGAAMRSGWLNSKCKASNATRASTPISRSCPRGWVR